MAEVDDILSELLRLRGAEYVFLADRANGRIIAEAGKNGSTTLGEVVVRLETMVSDVLGPDSDDRLDDLMISSRHRYYLIRQIDALDSPPLLLCLRLQRNRANLAVARRELASADLRDRIVEILRNPAAAEHHNGVRSAPGKADHNVQVPLPRRAPAPSLPRQVGRERRSEPDERPTVLRQRWAFDQNTMERLLVGLRRLR